MGFQCQMDPGPPAARRAGPPGVFAPVDAAHGRCMALWEVHIASLVPHPLLCAGSEDRSNGRLGLGARHFPFAEGGRRRSDLAQFPHHQTDIGAAAHYHALPICIWGLGPASRTNRAKPPALATTDRLLAWESATSTSLERQRPPFDRRPLPYPFLRKMSPSPRPQWHRNQES